MHGSDCAALLPGYRESLLRMRALIAGVIDLQANIHAVFRPSPWTMSKAPPAVVGHAHLSNSGCVFPQNRVSQDDRVRLMQSASPISIIGATTPSG